MTGVVVDYRLERGCSTRLDQKCVPSQKFVPARECRPRPTTRCEPQIRRLPERRYKEDCTEQVRTVCWEPHLYPDTPQHPALKHPAPPHPALTHPSPTYTTSNSFSDQAHPTTDPYLTLPHPTPTNPAQPFYTKNDPYTHPHPTHPTLKSTPTATPLSPLGGSVLSPYTPAGGPARPRRKREESPPTLTVKELPSDQPGCRTFSTLRCQKTPLGNEPAAPTAKLKNVFIYSLSCSL